ncbi:MAG: NYN domain-containing protein [Candidatus Omnitrophota bacterium]
MSLQYVIDGYNITNHRLFPRAHKKNIQVHASLVTFIISRRLTGSSKNKVTIVFDGYPLKGHSVPEGENFDIIFSRVITADEKIKKIVESLGNRRSIVVVSDDRQLQFTVKSLGARCMGIEDFICGQAEKRRIKREETVKAELNFTQIGEINTELRRLWLKE